MNKKIGVVGSINTDIVTKTDIVPKEGETVIGNEYLLSNGGKGANVAVAGARLKQDVNLIGCVGGDVFSNNALLNLKTQNVNVSGVTILPNEQGGVANIILCNENNRIIVVSGANMLLDKDLINKNIDVIKECSIVGGQFEVPVETLFYVSKICYDNNIKFVLNLSPIKKYPLDIIKYATYIVVNEVEIKEIDGYNEDKPYDILKKYPNKLILTKGGDGVFYFNGKEVVNVPAIKVNVVDTTGAGDTFLGSFMVAINNDMNLLEAITFANICAGLKTTKIGAQTGMPTLDEVKQYVKENDIKIDIKF